MLSGQKSATWTTTFSRHGTYGALMNGGTEKLDGSIGVIPG
jgi:hypothetical protein